MVSERVCTGEISNVQAHTDWTPERWKVSAITIDRDAADILCLGGFRRRDGQDAVLERGRDFALIDVFER